MNRIPKMSYAQPSAGAPYGARDPHACGDVNGNKLILLENVSLELGKARRYNSNEDFNVPNIDVTFPVYPIGGRFREYFCVGVSNILQNQGKKCLLSEHANATGLCFKDERGSWLCSMGDASSKTISNEAAPPGGKLAPQTIARATRPVTPRPAAPQPPAPDFFGLAKWFDIVRYDYADQQLNIVAKLEVPNPPAFCMQFVDRDGVMEQPSTWVSCLRSDNSRSSASICRQT